MAIRRKMSVAALALAGVFCFACRSGETPAGVSSGPKPIVETIALKPGEKHVFVWAENATTGFSWQTVTNSATIAVSIEHKEPAPIGVPGCGVSGGARVMVAAREGFEGRARAVLKNMRPWNGETAETRVVKVELR
jgi:predicted secreted protein